MRTIHLHGILGEKLGEKWELAVESVAEGLRAINANTGGKLVKVISEMGEDGGKYRILIGDKDHDGVEDLQVKQPKNIEDFHIVPVVESGKAATRIIIGALLVLAVFFPPFAGFMGASLPGIAGAGGATYGGVFLSIGVSLILGGLVELIIGSPELDSQTSNLTFDSEVNVARQGTAIPLIYGEYMGGSQVVNFYQYSKEGDEEKSTLDSRQDRLTVNGVSLLYQLVQDRSLP